MVDHLKSGAHHAEVGGVEGRGDAGLQEAAFEVIEDGLVHAVIIQVPGGAVGSGNNHYPTVQEGFKYTCRCTSIAFGLTSV